MKKLPSGVFVHALLVILLGAGTIGRAQPAPIATVALTQGWATFGEAVPQGPPSTRCRSGSLPTQTDVKTQVAGRLDPLRRRHRHRARRPARTRSAAAPAAAGTLRAGSCRPRR